MFWLSWKRFVGSFDISVSQGSRFLDWRARPTRVFFLRHLRRFVAHQVGGHPQLVGARRDRAGHRGGQRGHARDRESLLPRGPRATPRALSVRPCTPLRSRGEGPHHVGRTQRRAQGLAGAGKAASTRGRACAQEPDANDGWSDNFSLISVGRATPSPEVSDPTSGQA